jgi:hypothetical protein
VYGSRKYTFETNFITPHDIPRNTAKILMAGGGISWILIGFEKLSPA